MNGISLLIYLAVAAVFVAGLWVGHKIGFRRGYKRGLLKPE